MHNSILIVDDDKSVRDLLRNFFRKQGYLIHEAGDGKTAINLFASGQVDLVLLDLRLPDISGFDVLEAIKTASPMTGVIILTGHGDVETAVRAMQRKADNFVLKPFKPTTLLALIQKTLEAYQSQEQMQYLKAKVSPLTGEDYREKLLLPHDLYSAINLMAQNQSTNVLIIGETGTGKGVIAAAIHELSARNAGQFVDINCASLRGELLESELFGHERGAFTDAKTFKKGLLEIADGGTVFLDEVAEMPLAAQAKLLKVLENKTFRRLGGTSSIGVDVRIIAATNANLEQKVKQGGFREDLYYRLNVMPIMIPPLRERRKDILKLAERFRAEFSYQFNRPVTTISSVAADALQEYSWPGNIRELRNVIERAVLLCSGDELMPEHLPDNLLAHEVKTRTRGKVQPLHEMERQLIINALWEFGGNRSRAAEALGIHRQTLINKIKLYKLERQKF